MIGILILLLFFAATMMADVGSPSAAAPAAPERCGPHQWVTRQRDEKLVCCHCGFVAGSFSTESGEY